MHSTIGIIPYALLNMPSRKRGYNPLSSFAAVGESADELVNNQSEKDVFAPLHELYHRSGYLLLMGVDLRSATLIHYAEKVAGRMPFARWANNLNGESSICNTGGCSDGFNNFSEKVCSIERKITVGNSLWRCFPAREFVDTCVNVMKEIPKITQCANLECSRCNDAILGGPLW